MKINDVLTASDVTNVFAELVNEQRKYYYDDRRYDEAAAIEKFYVKFFASLAELHDSKQGELD